MDKKLWDIKLNLLKIFKDIYFRQVCDILAEEEYSPL